MKVRKLKRYELCYVNRLVQEVYVYFDSVNDILEYVDLFGCVILYVKTCYDFKKHQFIYNYLSTIRKD